MILSRNKGFAFIHIPKTAGTSISRVLRKYDDRSVILKFLDTKPVNLVPVLRNLNPFPYHITTSELKQKLGEDTFDNLFTFAFVRNTWDWNVSRYHYIAQSLHHPKHRIVREMAFKEFVRWLVKKSGVTQSCFVTDSEGSIIVCFIGKFEKLADDFARGCDQLCINESLPHRNPSEHEHYREYYDERTSKIVENHFQRDISLFDYEF